MATDLSYLNQIINDRRRDTGTGSVDISTVGFRAINSTLQIWNEIHDFPWTIKTANINYNNGIYLYASPSDFKFPVDLRTYSAELSQKPYNLVSPIKFPNSLYSQRFAVSNESGIQYLKIRSLEGGFATINAASEYDSEGTWVGGGAVSNVSTSNYNGFSLPSSVSFDFSGTSGTLTNSTFTPLDLTRYKNRSNLYLDIDLPTISNFSSISLKWGTDASNYYTVTSTTNYVGQTPAVGWNKIKSAWSSPTTIGTPTLTSIGYLQITIVFSVNPSASDFHIQNIFVSENIPLVLTYYSINMVTTLLGVQSQLFASANATTDTPMWSGRWDVATEPFIQSVLETIFFITGEYNDMNLARQKILEIVTPLKQRYPSQRKYPSLQISADINI